MREIKFRAWHTGECFMIEWDFILDDGILPYFSSDDYILMQYTGLKDRNGVEIYEGDIVRTRKGRTDTEYVTDVIHEHTMFRLRENKTLFVDGRCMIGCEVIGNIHENPDLLDG